MEKSRIQVVLSFISELSEIHKENPAPDQDGLGQKGHLRSIAGLTSEDFHLFLLKLQEAEGSVL